MDYGNYTIGAGEERGQKMSEQEKKIDEYTVQAIIKLIKDREQAMIAPWKMALTYIINEINAYFE